MRISSSIFFFLMIRRPPRSTRTDTLVPYTTLFRSVVAVPRRFALSGSVAPLVLRPVDVGSMLDCDDIDAVVFAIYAVDDPVVAAARAVQRSEEHTSELQSLMRISYAVFCLKKKT